MTQTIRHLGETATRLGNREQQRLGVLLLAIILVSLALYIYMLNFSISESYRHERFIKEARLISQDMQSREEFLITRLQEFYDTHASSFVSTDDEPQFVVRSAGVARVPKNSSAE